MKSLGVLVLTTAFWAPAATADAQNSHAAGVRARVKGRFDQFYAGVHYESESEFKFAYIRLDENAYAFRP